MKLLVDIPFGDLHYTKLGTDTQRGKSEAGHQPGPQICLACDYVPSPPCNPH